MKQTVKYSAIIYFDDMYDKPHRRHVIVTAKKSERPKDVYNRLKNENGVTGIDNFRRIE